MKKIEVYYDPSGCLGGKPGCFKARLAAQHSCGGAGRTPIEAKQSCVTTAKSFGKPGDCDDYELVDLGTHEDNPDMSVLATMLHHPGRI